MRDREVSLGRKTCKKWRPPISGTSGGNLYGSPSRASLHPSTSRRRSWGIFCKHSKWHFSTFHNCKRCNSLNKQKAESFSTKHFFVRNLFTWTSWSCGANCSRSCWAHSGSSLQSRLSNLRTCKRIFSTFKERHFDLWILELKWTYTKKALRIQQH